METARLESSGEQSEAARPFRVRGTAADGTTTVFRPGPDDVPQPIPDDELDHVAGGWTYEMNFADGCVYRFENPPDSMSLADLLAGTAPGAGRAGPRSRGRCGISNGRRPRRNCGQPGSRYSAAQHVRERIVSLVAREFDDRTRRHPLRRRVRG